MNLVKSAVLSLAIVLVASNITNAGAWPRERGSVFLSFSQDISQRSGGQLSLYSSAYAEYGFRDRLTLGARYGSRHGAEQELVGFARYALNNGSGANRFAVEIGLGAGWSPAIEPVYIVQPGLHWGRGFQTSWGDAWAGVETLYAAAPEAGLSRLKLDVTLGLSPTENSHAIVQLRGYRDTFGSNVTVAPSYVRRVFGDLRAEIGGSYALDEPRDSSVFVGTWMEF